MCIEAIIAIVCFALAALATINDLITDYEPHKLYTILGILALILYWRA